MRSERRRPGPDAVGGRSRLRQRSGRIGCSPPILAPGFFFAIARKSAKTGASVKCGRLMVRAAWSRGCADVPIDDDRELPVVGEVPGRLLRADQGGAGLDAVRGAG